MFSQIYNLLKTWTGSLFLWWTIVLNQTLENIFEVKLLMSFIRSIHLICFWVFLKVIFIKGFKSILSFFVKTLSWKNSLLFIVIYQLDKLNILSFFVKTFSWKNSLLFIVIYQLDKFLRYQGERKLGMWEKSKQIQNKSFFQF